MENNKWREAVGYLIGALNAIVDAQRLSSRESSDDQPQEQQCVPDLTSTIQMLQRNEQVAKHDQMNVVEDTTYVVEARETRKGKGKGRTGLV